MISCYADHRNYYQTLYQRCFGTPQSVRNLELASPQRSQMLSTPLTSTGARNLPETPSTGSSLNPTQGNVMAERPGFLDMDHAVLRGQNYPLRTGTGLDSDAQYETSSFASHRRFDYKQQFLPPLHSEAETTVSSSFPEHSASDRASKKVPAALSRPSELHNSQQTPVQVTTLQANEMHGGSFCSKPSSDFDLGDHVLALKADCQNQMPAESLAMDPSQSLFTQQDGSAFCGGTQSKFQAEQCLSPSPPLDLSPENETFHLLKAQSQNQWYKAEAICTEESKQPCISLEEMATEKCGTLELGIMPMDISDFLHSSCNLQFSWSQSSKNVDTYLQQYEIPPIQTSCSDANVSAEQHGLRPREQHQESPLEVQDFEMEPENIKMGHTAKVSTTPFPAAPVSLPQESSHHMQDINSARPVVAGACVTSAGQKHIQPDTGQGGHSSEVDKSDMAEQGQTDPGQGDDASKVDNSDTAEQGQTDPGQGDDASKVDKSDMAEQSQTDPGQRGDASKVDKSNMGKQDQTDPGQEGDASKVDNSDTAEQGQTDPGQGDDAPKVDKSDMVEQSQTDMMEEQKTKPVSSVTRRLKEMQSK